MKYLHYDIVFLYNFYTKFFLPHEIFPDPDENSYFFLFHKLSTIFSQKC